MRTTLDLDEDVLETARGLAAGRKISLGKAVSEMARRGSRPRLERRDGWTVFAVEGSTHRFGPKEVQEALGEDDVKYAKFLGKRKD